MPINIQKLFSNIEDEIGHLELGSTPNSLYDPLYYIMSLGGKRIRPLLTLLSYSLYRDNFQHILKPAIGVEVFHNFTLMHDDIMDNAPLRRGKTTVHEKWNPNIAILSGDVMLIKAYELLLHSEEASVKHVLKSFNTCATEVCEGQQLDMDFEKRDDVSEEEYIEMIRLKTAVLLGFSLELGAILAGAPTEDCEALRDFGINIGIGFQLKDDLLDVYADKANFGKQVGGDILANKKTFLLLDALKRADGLAKKELVHWLSVTDYEPDAKVNAVKHIYNELNVKQKCEELMTMYFDIGFTQLNMISASKPRVVVLKKFTTDLMDRVK